jgi:hypothetical protein
VAALAYTPSVQDVARYLRARTRGPDGSEVGTFDSTTVPTDDQVEAIIDLAMPIVSGMLGLVPATCEVGARSLAALKAAEMIEVSYFPEQLAPGGTVTALRALYADLLPAVQMCVSGDGTGGGGADNHDSTPASSGFWDCDPFGGRYGRRYDGGRWIDGRDPVETIVRVIDTEDLNEWEPEDL